MNILETNRLLLRELTLDDVDALNAILSDPVAMEHYPKPHDREMTAEWIRRNLVRYAEHGFGLWAVILKATGELIGDCGLTYQHVNGVDELEIGYHIARPLWNKGYATEAASGCRDYVSDVLKRDRVISWMRPTNHSSRRVAEKVGMTLEKETTDRNGFPAVVYSMSFKQA